MQLSLAYSPCPNDTFMMDALVHDKLKQSPFDFEVHIADVEELNEAAFESRYDLTKLSYHAFLHLSDRYELLHAGSALGHGVGPLLIALKSMSDDEIFQGPCGLPGKWTTAHFLYQLRYPHATNKRFGLFSEIEDKIHALELACGVIIHENRFTYSDRGLVCLEDLGTFWENETNLPIPLGAIAVRKDLAPAIKNRLNDLLVESIQIAFENPAGAMPYVRQHAQEMDPEVMQKHIDLYVNDFSLDLGNDGREAIDAMVDMARSRGLIGHNPKNIFI